MLDSFLVSAAALAALAGTVKILMVFWKWFAPKLTGCWYRMTGFDTAMQRLSTIELTMTSMERLLVNIEKEMRPNHGTSFRDAIDANRAMLKSLDQRMRANDIHSSLGLFDTDRNGTVIWVNRTLARIVGRQVDELLGWNWVNTVHPEDRDIFVHEYKSALEEKREYHAVVRLVTFDHEIIRVRVDAAVLRFENGDFQGYRGRVCYVECSNAKSCPKNGVCDSCELRDIA